MLDVHGSLQLLDSSHVRERDKALLRSIMVGGVWNGFLFGKVREQPVPCRFCFTPVAHNTIPPKMITVTNKK